MVGKQIKHRRTSKWPKKQKAEVGGWVVPTLHQKEWARNLVVARKNEEVNWLEYFASIRSVCPWSKAYWLKQKIDIRRWRGEHNIVPLGDYVARVWIHPNASSRTLCNIHYRLNTWTKNEEWLYSHPIHKKHSTPVPVLIQQDQQTLNKARQRIGNVWIAQ